VRTRVGYAGGVKENSTYKRIGDHTETIQIDYDPRRISFRQLLDLFWTSHQPQSRPWSTQYKAAIFYHDDEQRKSAEETREKIARQLGGMVRTEILPFRKFFMAEDYHQKYRLRGYPEFLRELRGIYPDGADPVHSTAAARLNGYLAGYGNLEEIKAHLGSLGLPPESQRKLLKIMERRRSR
jgi:peptide-methionine (S)-S-oxide reductase